MKNNISIDDIDLFLFDFDGVLTNNCVYISEEGTESVRCDRSDGIGFEALRKLKKLVYIISTETNPVVSVRAKKIKVKTIQGVRDKKEAMDILIDNEKIDKKKVIFIGNDINDFQAMKNCSYSACPSDSHPKIKNIATFILNKNGGEGVVIDLLENVMGLDLTNIVS